MLVGSNFADLLAVEQVTPASAGTRAVVWPLVPDLAAALAVALNRDAVRH